MNLQLIQSVTLLLPYDSLDRHQLTCRLRAPEEAEINKDV